MSATENEVLIPVANAQAMGLGVGRRSIGRRIKDANSGFPPTIRIGGRLYATKSELDNYKARLIRDGRVDAARIASSVSGEAS
jgi:predicted DNA-binding transcriptional regulator AlpA